MAESSNTFIQAIFEEALEDSFRLKCCLNCKHSYLNAITGHGSCKHTLNNSAPISPRPITEWDSCTKWSVHPAVRLDYKAYRKKLD